MYIHVYINMSNSQAAKRLFKMKVGHPVLETHLNKDNKTSNKKFQQCFYLKHTILLVLP